MALTAISSRGACFRRQLLSNGFPLVRIKQMCDPLQGKPLLSAEALDGLRHARRQIVDAAAGRLPDRLVRSTAAVAAQLARREATPAEVLPRRVRALVRLSL